MSRPQTFTHMEALTSLSNNIIITIDGPAASGKSSVGRLLAKKLHFVFVSSGSYYRALAWSALQENIDVSQETNILVWLKTLHLETRMNDGEAHPLINQVDPMNQLFEKKVNVLVSPLAASSAVRNFLLRTLRELALGLNIVMEGRDIGSVVFPETRWKFYLHASDDERIRRRTQEGEDDSILERDRIDSTRQLAPLMIPKGATVIDTTHLGISEVTEKIFTDLKDSQ